MSMSNGDKRAALELHALGPQDREWVLGRLPAADRSRVLPLLAELDAMEIRFDLEGAGLAAAGHPATRAESPAAPTGAASSPSAQSIIRDASAADVLRILSEEPAWLVRAVFALDAWPWLAPVQRALAGDGLRWPSPAPRGAPSLPPGLSAALLGLLAARLRSPAGALRGNGHHDGGRRVFHGGSAWSRVWPRVRQWLQ